MFNSTSTPIVLYPLQVHCGVKNRRDTLEFDFRARFSKYGDLWSFDVQEIHVDKKDRHSMSEIQIKISFDNEESRNIAIQREGGKIYDDKMKITPRFGELYNFKDIRSKTLSNPHVDINELMHCNNYWDKQLYPIEIIKEALQNPSNEFYTDPYGWACRDGPKCHFLFCLHPSIQYPFLIHLCSPTRSVQNVLHVRRQCVHEIARMLWNQYKEVETCFAAQLRIRG